MQSLSPHADTLQKYKNFKDRVYACMYDLQKAFDMIEYSILLKHLFHAGINGMEIGEDPKLSANWRAHIRVLQFEQGC